MKRAPLRSALIAASLLGMLASDFSIAQAEIPAGLFSNYYVGPPGVPAQLYLCPRPTPAYVGHTWITYPPFMPHEYLYHHRRTYYRFGPGGYTSASVKWH